MRMPICIIIRNKFNEYDLFAINNTRCNHLTTIFRAELYYIRKSVYCYGISSGKDVNGTELLRGIMV